MTPKLILVAADVRCLAVESVLDLVDLVSVHTVCGRINKFDLQWKCHHGST